MKDDENGFGLVEVLLMVLLIGAIGLIGWFVLSPSKVTVTTQRSYSSSGNCYDANGENFTESTPPSEDQLAVKPVDQKSVQLSINFKKDINDYKFNYNGICVVSENSNGKVTETIEFHLQKIEQHTQATSNTGLSVSIGAPKEFSSDFKPEGNYIVKTFIDTRDSVTNKSLGTTILSSSVSF